MARLFGMNGGKKRTSRLILVGTRCCNNNLNCYSVRITPPILTLKLETKRCEKEVHPSEPLGVARRNHFIEADRVDKKHFLQKNFYSATWGKREMMSRSDVDFTHGCLG